MVTNETVAGLAAVGMLHGGFQHTFRALCLKGAAPVVWAMHRFGGEEISATNSCHLLLGSGTLWV